jgi:hypothetical protein
MEKLESMRKYDNTTFISDIEALYKNFKSELEVKIIFNI